MSGWDAAEFLRAFQGVLEHGPNPLVWHETGRRMEEITDLGLTRNQVLEALARLQPSHRHRGPEPDDASPDGVVCMFRYPLDAMTHAYVKLAVLPHPKRDELIAKVWSFKRWS